MVQARRRVSYVIPPPVEPVPYLQLPPHGVSRLGAIGPLLISRRTNSDVESKRRAKHPRHRLGVSSLALDTSTQLAGRSTPEGILYSGGRDGLILSWDLGIGLKRRKVAGDDAVRRASGRWEIMTGWADDAIDEEAEEAEERLHGDGDILGDVTQSRRRTRRNSIPYESQWQTDLTAFNPGKHAEFRQSTQANTDWVNDIVLCNLNQTVISASSDGTVKSWSPHLQSPLDPSTIGSHSDYVRCLTHCREHNWVASGSFDRTIKLWDLTRSERHRPLATLIPPDTGAPKSSIYALASDPFGTTIASGSPERVIRLWDPWTGKRTGKLVGHTDNIRAILVSEDSRYLLTGSADASIKLWSLASQRCLHTFTHHTESVWSLSSSHPSLEVFYSGDRSGLVCRVDVEDCSDVSEGECILLCQDADSTKSSSDGINKIMVMDYNVIWTASGHSNIKRWTVPQRRSVRAAGILFGLDGIRSESPQSLGHDIHDLPSENSTRLSPAHDTFLDMDRPNKSMSVSSDFHRDGETGAGTTLYDIPFDSLVRMISPHEPFMHHHSSAWRGRDAEVATLYSAASIRSIPRTNAGRMPSVAQFRQHSATSPVRSPGMEGSVHSAAAAANVNTARTDYEERELASDAIPLRSEPDEVMVGDHGLVRSIILNDRMHALTVDTSGEVAVWNIVRGTCLGRFAGEDVAAASHAGSAAGGSGGDAERSPREVLEAARERIEGEAVVSSWAMADTKAGVLTIHLNDKSFEAEVYADEVGYGHDRRFNDESKINLGKWVLRNLFLGFIREEQKARRDHQDDASVDGVLASPASGQRTSSADLHIIIPRKTSSDSPSRPPPLTSSTIVRSSKIILALPPTSPAPTRTSPLLTPSIPIHVKDGSFPPSPKVNKDSNTGHRRLRSATMDNSDALSVPGSDDRASSRTRQPSLPDVIPPFDESPVPNGAGKLMGRLRQFGRTAGRRPVSEVAVPGSPLALAGTTSMTAEPEIHVAKTPAELLLAGPLSPVPSSEAPTYSIPANTTVYISQEASPSFTTVWRGTVGGIKYDVQALEKTLPLWLLEYLLLNKVPPLPPPPKLSFLLLPSPAKPSEEQLPELVNHNYAKLTASRYLRVRKLVNHVQEKLDGAPSPQHKRSSYEDHEPRTNPRAEDVYEILCNDVVLPLGLSLASVRQYVWKQSADMTMYYRRKAHPQDHGDDEIA